MTRAEAQRALIHCNEVEQSQLRFYVFWVIAVKKLEIAVVNNFLSLFFFV
jgi:hypothetical protein